MAITSRGDKNKQPRPRVRAAVKTIIIANRRAKTQGLQPGESISVGRDVVVKNTGTSRAEITVFAPASVVVGNVETVNLG